MSTRPVIKRQYGSKKPVNQSTDTALSSSSPRMEQLTKMGALPRSSASSDWSDSLFEDEDSGYGEMLTSELDSSSFKIGTSSSSPRIDVDMKDVRLSSSFGSDVRDAEEVDQEDVKPAGRIVRNCVVEKKVDLRSFFKAVSPIKKRRALDSDEENKSMVKNDLGRKKRITKKTSTTSNPFSSSSPIASTSTLSLSSLTTSTDNKDSKSSLTKTKSSKPTLASHAPPPKLSQLFLDPFETTSHATLSCNVCSMSYARTPDDIELHSKHHKRVVAGCDWLSLEKEISLASQSGGGGGGGRVVEDGIEWGGKEGGKIVMIDATVDGLAGRRINDILSTIDRELSATSLTPAQLVDSKLFLFVTPQRKVIAAGLIQRIQSSYQVIPSNSLSSSSSSTTSTTSSSPYLSSNSDLLRFGEDSGAVFCSSQLFPTLLGVHRIWTSSSHRSLGLATLLLDSVAKHFIYGCPILKEDRWKEVAFSQPTAGGMRLAKRWTGREGFRVFVE